MIFRLARLIKVIWTLGRYDAILPHEYQELLPPSAKLFGKLLRLGAKKDGQLGSRMSIALEELGAVWIKLGQILATRPDIVGIDAAAELSGLKDRVKPFDTKIARRILATEFTRGDEGKLDEKFGELGEIVAAASVAQVYKIKAKDGRDLALKILRPNIIANIKRDLDALMLGAKIYEFLFPKMKRVKPVVLVETIKRALDKETDLRQEAGSADAYAQICAIDGLIKIPKVEWEFVSKSTLATEWIDGKPLTLDGALDGFDKKDLALRINRSFLISALEYGFFHADLHEGNLIITKDGELYAIDFGIMGWIDKSESRRLANILYSFIRRDYRAAASVHFNAGFVPKEQNIGEFAVALRAVCEPIWGRKASEVSMGRVLLQLFDVTERFGMELQPQLVLLQKTMVQVEGVARNIYFEHDIWEAAGPIVERFMKRELGPEGALERTKEHLEQLLSALMKLPELVEKMEKLVEEK